jgi:hypothetical protein
MLALVLSQLPGLATKARHQGHLHTATQKTEAFAINAKLWGGWSAA